MSKELSKLRNIGISAHIDSGKTTLTERILYYTNRIRAIHEVRGKDGVGAKMDAMELERERGITIQSAATSFDWGDYRMNLIDTPGHVDFTIEVERALRVLDGAILVLCAVAGVQSQSITVDRQMRRYSVPRLAFVNKCDRSGAHPVRVTADLRDKLKLNAVLMQLPLGLEAEHEGVIDLVTMKAIYFDGPGGDDMRVEAVPTAMQADAKTKREEMLDAVSMFSEPLMEAILEDRVTEELIHEAVRAGTLGLELVPVYLGSAYKNKGVQPLLDAVTRYLPSPLDIVSEGIDLDRDEAKIVLSSEPDAPLVALAFKLEDGSFGQLTYVRIYQGVLRKGDEIVNARTHKRVRVSRLVRMHSDEMEEINDASSGDIVALFGIDCASGDTFTPQGVQIAMTSMYVPEPVISLAIRPKDIKAQTNLAKALQRFSKEDPTFRVSTDEETGDTVIAGMGELHLEVYTERIKREYKAEVETGRPQVAYREAVTEIAEFDYLHKKQTGGSGQYARVIGHIEPNNGEGYEFLNEIHGGAIPREYVTSVNKGFKAMLGKGPLIGYPVIDLKVVLSDGNTHDVDSSDNAFRAAARGAFRQAYSRAKPIILEPVMKVEVEGPSEFQGAMLRTVMQRRGLVIGTNEFEGFCRLEVDVPLAEMFGYSTDLRSCTQGKAEFTMEFAKYAPAPREVSEALIAEALAQREAKS